MRIDKTYSELWNLVNDHEDNIVQITAEMAIKTLKKLQKENEQIKGAYKDREDDIEFYWSQFHEIERIRTNPDTSDDEKWEKIGELISSILVVNEFD